MRSVGWHAGRRLRRSRWPLILLAAGLAVGLARLPVRADDNADQNLYVDYVAGAWDDWSWDSSRAWNSSEHAFSYEHAAKLSFSKAWGAIRLHYRGVEPRGLDTTGFTDLVFFINWGGKPAQQMLVYALRNSDFNKTIKLDLAKYTAKEEDLDGEPGWLQVQVPLTALGVAKVQDLTDIILTGPTVNVPFWIDDVMLVKPPGPSRINLNVDATRRLRRLDGRHLGINTATWDPLLTDAGTTARVQEMGARFFRFPGGSSADSYHWQQNTIDTAKTGADTLDFMKLVQAASGEAIITVNYGTGTPQEAADWVSFCNVLYGFNVQYWEVGNENYGDWETGSHDPVEYAKRFADFYVAMKSVDRTIQIGMPGPLSPTDYNGWGPKVLQNLKVAPDFYSVHYFPQTPWSTTPHEDDADLLQCAKDWKTIATLARGMLSQYLGPAGAGVEIVATENGSVGSSSPGKQSVNLVSALYLADSFGQVLNTEIGSYMWWDLHNGYQPTNNNSPVLYGQRLFGDFGILSTNSHPTAKPNTPYPSYYALQLCSELAGPGSQLIDSASNSELLPIYSSLRADGSLTMLVVNKDSQRSMRATLNVTGFAPVTARVQQYGAFNDAVDVGVTTYEVAVPGPRFAFVFPSYSMTVLTLRPAKK